MQKVGRLCLFCLHKLWLLLAVSLVLLAALVSILRYSLPYATHYKSGIETFLSSQYGTEVRIGELSANWQAGGPALLLHELEFASDSQQLGFSVAKASIQLDFWRSIRSMQLRSSHVGLSGVELRLVADHLLAGGDDNRQEPLTEALEQLFFRQLQQFIIHDSRVRLELAHSAPIWLSVRELSWRNQGLRHQGQGRIAVEGVTGNSLSFVLDLHGERLETTFGQLYVQSEQLDIQPWLRQFLPELAELEYAHVNLQAWGRVDQGAIQRIQVDLADNTLGWHDQQQQQWLKLSQGQLLWYPHSSGWSLFSSELQLSDAEQSYPGIELQVHRKQQAVFGQLQQLQLDALQPLIALIAEQRSELAMLARLQPGGQVSKLSWQVQPDDWQLTAELVDLHSQPDGDIPGVQQLNGHLVAAAGFAELELHSQDSALLWQGAFSEPMRYQQLQARLQLRQSRNNWQLRVHQLSMQDEQVQADAQLVLNFSDQPELFLLATADGVAVSNAMHFYPRHYMPASIIDYLSESLQGGEVRHAATLWHGPLASFPFRQQEGVFQSTGQVEQGRMQFQPDWPELTGIAAELWFENSSMQIESRAAHLLGLHISEQVEVRIDDLFQADTLYIAIETAAEAHEVQALMQQSPLAGSVGEALAYVGLQGPVQSSVQLAIGLQQPSVRAQGKVRFDGNQAYLRAPELKIEQISGQLQFDNDRIDATELAASWLGLPFALQLTGQQDNEQYELALQLAGQQDAAQLLSKLPITLPELASGDAGWQLQLDVQLPGDGFAYQAQLQANFDQTELALPAPYAKAAGEEAALEVWVQGTTEQSLIRAAYSKPLYFQARLQHDSGAMDQVLLRLGGRHYGTLEPGLVVDIELEATELMPWFELLLPPLTADTQGTHRLWPALSRVRGRVASMQLTDQLALHQTLFELTPNEEYWGLQLNGAEVASQWRFYHDWYQRGIEIEMDYLRLKAQSTEQPQTDQQPAAERQPMTWLQQLPPIRLRCQDCSYNSYALGQVQAELANTEQGLELKRLQADYKRNQLQLSGYWQPDHGLGQSHFQGQLSSPNFGALLSEYELSSAISGSRADILFDLHWQGSPLQFELASLGGTASWLLGEGSLSEVSDKGARLFSLFSLNSLMRKLRLDFRDVFAKGFYYNRMQGDISLHKGVAQTSNSTIDGVAGNLSMQGYADLVNRKLDYQMTLVPKVTSSLPVIIAWMVNPVSGLAALALDEMFTSAEVISRVNFTVTGTIDEPIVTEVNRHSTEVPVPVRVAQPKPGDESELHNDQPHGD
ncbi:YhdP family protein [Alkalimonas mucilaginosa]|uniref:YhdP family protein n=1 Tax=Alkalimonas mucilaginosa TaxID=3057676 RepID=A0ABU7JJN0_9GAMM|nr:YhdP family protein [Alkalimonas sp. MEB004]MEE2025909.1 YhdP family protein [Alkalimonas sp. MEB004]